MMIDFNVLYNMSYEELKNFLLHWCKDEERETILSDRKIKEMLINPENRHDFTWLVYDDKDGKVVPTILDDEGIALLKGEEYKTKDKLNAIFSSEQKFLPELFKREAFCKCLVEKFNYIQNDLCFIDEKSASIFFDYLSINNPELISNFLSVLNDRSAYEVLKKVTLTRNEVVKLLPFKSNQAFEYIIKTTPYTDVLNDCSYYYLTRIFEQDIPIPEEFLMDENFLKKLTTIFDPKAYRLLMTKLSRTTDISKIEKVRKEYYDEQISGFDPETKMVPMFKEAYEKLLSIEKGELEFSTIIDMFSQTNFLGNEDLVWQYYSIIFERFTRKDMDGIKEFFQQQSNALMTDMIIDYHFEGIYDNVLKDIKQLLDFQKLDGTVVDEETAEIYRKIVTLDDLPYEEKKELHSKLKENNWVEKFYDDYLNARRRVEERINEVVLTEDKLQKYRDPKSDEIGVDIYILDGDPFYALVKSVMTSKEEILDRLTPYNKSTSSVSLDSSLKLRTFYDPRERYNIIYSGLPKDHTAHIYPVDSFTTPGKNKDGLYSSSRINHLMTPEQLSKASGDYNEIFVVQKPDNTPKEDNGLEQLPVLGIYCYDEITENDIESAKRLGCGIVCVKTKSYTPYKSDNQIKMHERTFMSDKKKQEHEYTTSIQNNQNIDRRK